MGIHQLEIAVVILNYNGSHHLKTFLPSVVKYSSIARVVVADNGSTDNSVEVLRQFREVELIQLPQNYGFCGGYNRALAQIESKYYVLLNSDVEVTAAWITPLFEAMESDDNIAACQPKIKAYHQKEYFEYAGAAGGYIDFLGYPFNRGRFFEETEKDVGQYNDEVSIFWATGACMMVRADLYHNLGGLDEDFFAHMEEIDLCWRLKRAGFTIKYVGSSEVYHVGGGTLHKSSPRKTFLNFRNSLLVLAKNLPTSKAIVIIFLRLCLDGVAGIRFLLTGDAVSCWAIIRSHFSFYKLLPKMISKKVRLPKDEEKIAEVYLGSIVWDYFVKKKRSFKELHFLR